MMNTLETIAWLSAQLGTVTQENERLNRTISLLNEEISKINIVKADWVSKSVSAHWVLNHYVLIYENPKTSD